jgi:rhamnogalacturonyl hydrolase YesR
MFTLLLAVTFPIGVSSDLKPITATLPDDAFDYRSARTRVLFVNTRAPKLDERRFSVAEIANVPETGYPPAGNAYQGAAAPAHYVWRFIMMHAPDLVVGPPDLVRALPEHGIPAVAPGAAIEPHPPSAARREIQRRLARSPGTMALELAKHYGHKLPDVVYIPAVALIGRVRLGETADVERIVEPYLKGAPTLPGKVTGSHLSGHLVFAELARNTGNRRYIELVQRAADPGRDAEVMPHHQEMSDAVFMGTPILAEAGRLTGDRRYLDAAIRHMRYMLKLNLRKDGLHRHSPLDDAAWGRGNGFPALGLAWTLDAMPRDFGSRTEVAAALRAHLEALAPRQDASGMWHQVIDKPESYRELTATCMIGYAMLRAMRNGVVKEAEYRPAVDRAWSAVNARVASGGTLFDVCTGTGKQKSLADYFERAAIWGQDDRGGAMALLFAVEMMGR